MYKRRKPRRTGASLLFPSFGLACPHIWRMYFPLLANKTELKHWSVHCFKFLLWRDRTKEITNSPDKILETTVLAKFNKNSLTAFPGKGGLNGLVTSQLCLSTKGCSEEYFRSGLKVHDQLLDILLFG